MNNCTENTNHELALRMAIAALGGATKFAKAVGASSAQAVDQWRRNGVPAKYCLRIERLTGISRNALRPNDWRDYWADLDDVQ